uniref:Uncharacterized protein n=1 Tax=Myoviridae sp. ctZ2t4 TaxID=2827693 RepID=A0A8S5SSW3_9CAUD|nr:MAG TPA: hypothetical protein [Myoviridae sp. ctZ2t4]
MYLYFLDFVPFYFSHFPKNKDSKTLKENFQTTYKLNKIKL